MAVLTELDLPQYRQSLRKCIAFLNNIEYSPVKTKYNAKGNWDAISIRGYSDDIGNILKPGVLKSDVKAEPLKPPYHITSLPSTELNVISGKK